MKIKLVILNIVGFLVLTFFYSFARTYLINEVEEKITQFENLGIIKINEKKLKEYAESVNYLVISQDRRSFITYLFSGEGFTTFVRIPCFIIFLLNIIIVLRTKQFKHKENFIQNKKWAKEEKVLQEKEQIKP